MLEIVPRVDYPPRVLGTITQNQRWAMTKDFDEQDDEEADPARLAIKRAEAAKKLCEAIKELSVADVEGPSIAAGWATRSKCAARALDSTPGSDQATHYGSTGGYRIERGGAQHPGHSGMQLASTIKIPSPTQLF